MVQKYGGSSVADLERIRAVAVRIAKTRSEGLGVVAVVSAMGNTTNELIALARELTSTPDPRELDMLVSVGERITMALVAMALRDLGVPAVSLTGSQSGIITDERHADARVVAVRPARLRQVLDEGKVAIVAGFQGVSRDREVTTLGRGGSDTTAVVLAAALGARWCEICSDVDGVWSGDPRVVPDAHRLDAMGLGEALELARSGAKVLFEDAVRYARDHDVELRATSTFGPGAGTRLRVGAAPAVGARAVAGDEQLVALRGEMATREGVASWVGMGGRVRRHVGGIWHVDVRNVHQTLDGRLGGDVESIAVASLVGSGVAERWELRFDGESRLRASGIPVRERGGAGDALWWQVEPGALSHAVRCLHALVDSA